MLAKKKLISLLVCFIAGFILWCLPPEVFGIPGLSIIEQRVIAIFIFGALMWITESVPIWTNSVFIMVFMLLTVSTSSFKPLYTADKAYFKTSVVPVCSLEKKTVLLKSVPNNATALLVSDTSYISLGYNKKAVKAAAVDSEKLANVDISTVSALSSCAILTTDSTAISFQPVTVKDMKIARLDNQNVAIHVYDEGLLSASLGAKDAKVTAPSLQNIDEIEPMGTPINYKDIMASFADPIIMLFLGGFVLAIAAGKIGLDGHLAHILLKPFGTNPKIVLLGFLVVTGFFSMFMSNTATAAMMLAIMTPVLNSMRNPDGSFDKGCIGLAMAIPVGANIGGMGTPIGTPPNAIALKYLNDPDGLNLGIGFGQWMVAMIPVVILICLFAWFVLIKMFPFHTSTVKLVINHETFQKANKTQRIIICATFAVTVALWATDKLTGINSNVVALIPFAVFAITGIFTKDDLKLISWDVLWLVAGGFALGVGLDKSGLATDMINAIPFGSWSPIVVLVGAGLLCYLMSTFMSHTATSALLMPIMFAVGSGMDARLGVFGGITSLLLCVGLSASLAMALPISTPPNALAYSCGIVSQKQMASVGILVGIFGLIVCYIAMLFVIGPLHIFG